MTIVEKKVAILLIFLFSVLNQAELQIEEQCTTPDRKQGKCVQVKECKPIIDFLLNAKIPIPQKVAMRLMQYTCPYKNNITTVCCPSEKISFDDLLDSTNHKNLHLLPPDCGVIDTGDKIRNGINAQLLEFPWMALLSYNTSKGPQYNCGGTIISERYILTAAHCITGTPDPLVGVRVAEYDTSSETDCVDDHCVPPVQDLTIEKTITHPEYNITLFANDIGLIRVSKINLTVENAKTVCLPIAEDIRNQKFNMGTVTGWGSTNVFGKKATILQQVQLPIHNLTTCTKAYEKLGVKFSDNQICAGGSENKDSCGGDSGGPLHAAAYFDDDHRYVQQGIVSIGHAHCGLVGYPSVFTRVASHVNWILDSIEP